MNRSHGKSRRHYFGLEEFTDRSTFYKTSKNLMVLIMAPAKLTLSLEITGVRTDGYHLIKSEMVSLDLIDILDITEGGRHRGSG